MDAAPFWRRLLADVIDLALVAGTTWVMVGAGIGAPMDLPPKRFDWIDYTADLLADYGSVFVPPLVLLCGLGIIYAVITRAALGAALGERLWGLRLLSAEGGRCGPLRALGHAIGTILGVLLGLVGYAWAAVDLRRQGLAEYVSGTVLIRSNSAPD